MSMVLNRFFPATTAGQAKGNYLTTSVSVKKPLVLANCK